MMSSQPAPHIIYSDSSRGGGHPGGRQRKRNEPSPTLPKLQGRVGEWENFEFQFDMMADLYDWDEELKLTNLKACLSNTAVSFVRTLPIENRNNYYLLRKCLKQRFQGAERPDLLRKDLHDIKQLVDETVDEFADRIHNLTSIAFQDIGPAGISMLGTEYFIRGVRDRTAAYEAAKENPETIQQALAAIKNAAALQKTILGRAHIPSARQVTFSEESIEIPPSYVGFQSSWSPKPPKVPAVSVGTQCQLPGSPTSPRRSLSPQRTTRRPLHDRCFHCDKPGHFRSQCPLLVENPKEKGSQ
jgi:hypothetical protein